jgi:hypothetical protein
MYFRQMSASVFILPGTFAEQHGVGNWQWEFGSFAFPFRTRDHPRNHPLHELITPLTEPSEALQRALN